MTALLALLVLSQSPNIDAEVFLDRGETYLRAGQANGVEIGAALQVFDAKSRAPVGTAVVMEVWESLSRVNLDSKAIAYVPLKVARVGRQPEVAPVPAPPPAAPVVAAPLPPEPTRSQPVAATQQGAWLDGTVRITGDGARRRLLVVNKSNRDWHNCDVKLPNGKHYNIGDLDEGEDDGVMLFRFEWDRRVPPPAPTDAITVTCREGTGRFPINL